MSEPFTEDTAAPYAGELKLLTNEAMELRLVIYGIQDDLEQVNELLMNMAERLDEYLDDDPWPPGDLTAEPPPDEPVDYDAIPF